MMDSSLLLFVGLILILIIIVYGVSRYWDTMVRRSEDEETYDRMVADLNERQANRLTDEQLWEPVSDDDAWQIILRRGRRRFQRPRSRRPQGSSSRRRLDR